MTKLRQGPSYFLLVSLAHHSRRAALLQQIFTNEMGNDCGSGVSPALQCSALYLSTERLIIPPPARTRRGFFPIRPDFWTFTLVPNSDRAAHLWAGAGGGGWSPCNHHDNGHCHHLSVGATWSPRLVHRKNSIGWAMALSVLKISATWCIFPVGHLSNLALCSGR